MVTQAVLATVEKGRLAKAAAGYATGAYSVTLAAQSEVEVRGFVANGDGSVATLHFRDVPLCCSCNHEMEEGWHDRLQGEPI